MSGSTAELEMTHEQQVEADALALRMGYANTTSTFFAIAAVAIMVASGVAWVFAQDALQLLIFVVLLLPLLIGSLLYKYLAPRGTVTAGMIATVLGLALTTFGAPFIIPGMLAPAGVAYLIAITSAYILLGDKITRWLLPLLTVGLAVNVILADSVATAWFQPLDATVERIVIVITAGIALVVGGLLIRSTVLAQDRQFRRAQLATLELEERMGIEQMQREQLEQTTVEVEWRAANEQRQREQLEHLIGQVQGLINSLNAASTEIQAAVTQQLASASEQDASVTQTVATVEEVRATVQQTAERAQTVAEAAQESAEVSQQGAEAVDDTIEGMQTIRQQAENIAETILTLSGRMQQIGEIINTVNGLADQSKLLALNASIEAARAGEDGRGFAVVAMEVRQLAEQSRQATARIEEILSDIQQATNTAVMVTEEGSKRAERGVALATKAGVAIQVLSSTLAEVAQAAVQIAASTHQQTNGMEQLSAAMAQIKQASQQAAASSRQTDQSMRDLNQMARQLEETTQTSMQEA